MKRERCCCCDYESWLKAVVKTTIASEVIWFILWCSIYFNIFMGKSNDWLFTIDYQAKGNARQFGKNFAYVFAPMFFFLLMKMKAGWIWWR